jgi:hypothetical protein
MQRRGLDETVAELPAFRRVMARPDLWVVNLRRHHRVFAPRYAAL